MTPQMPQFPPFSSQELTDRLDADALGSQLSCGGRELPAKAVRSFQNVCLICSDCRKPIFNLPNTKSLSPVNDHQDLEGLPLRSGVAQQIEKRLASAKQFVVHEQLLAVAVQECAALQDYALQIKEADF